MRQWIVVGLLGLMVACGDARNTFGDDPTGQPGADAAAPTTDPNGYKDGGAKPNTATCTEAAKQQGYAGCDYVIAPVPLLLEFTRPPCFAALLANNANVPAKIHVSFGGADAGDPARYTRIPNNGDPSTWASLPADGIPALGVAVVFLSHDPTSKHLVLGTPLACPAPAAFEEPTGSAVPWPTRSKTFHITTDAPVTAYDIAPFGGAKSFFPSAEILLPTTSWGKNYVVAIPPLAVPKEPSSQPSESSWFQVVAQQDNTSVTIQAATDLEAPSMADAVPHNVSTTIKLSAGEYIQYHAWRVPQVAEDISGTFVASDKPVAVVGGDTATKIATKTTVKATPISGTDTTPRYCCLDSAHQQLPPISALGFDYVGAPYPTRRADLQEESILYRFVGVVDNTALTFDPPIAGAPTSMAKGEVVDFEVVGPVRIKSQDKSHPFYMSQTMSYSTVVGGTRRDGDATWAIQKQENGQRETGDPEWVGVLPPQQFIKQYNFMTDPTYAVTSLVVTRTNDGSGFKDVTIDCVGAVTGWQDVGSGSTYQMARIDLVRGGKGVGACSNGARSAKSDGTFGVTVWGVDWWASYAYSVGGSAFKINDVVVTPN